MTGPAFNRRSEQSLVETKGTRSLLETSPMFLCNILKAELHFGKVGFLLLEKVHGKMGVILAMNLASSSTAAQVLRRPESGSEQRGKKPVVS